MRKLLFALISAGWGLCGLAESPSLWQVGEGRIERRMVSGQAVKDQKNTCVECGRKGSVAKGREVKINVHHKDGIRWDNLIQLIRDQLLQTPDKYVCMCEECHVKLHKEEKEKEINDEQE